MAGAVGSIVIDVTADIGPLVKEMNRAKQTIGGMAGVTGGLSRGLGQIGDRASDLGRKMSIATGAIAAAGGALFLLTKNAATNADRIGEAAAAAGVAAGYYQEMGFAIKEVTGVAQEDFDKALITINKRLGEAKEGSYSATAAFAKIGISQADLASGAVTTEQAMDALVTTLGNTSDPALAAALTSDLLGKVWAKMGGSLAGAAGSVDALRARAQELGVVLDQDALNAASKYDQKMTELGASMEALKMNIANELLPVLVDRLLPFLIDTLIPAVGKVVDKLGEWIDWFATVDPAIQTLVSVFVAAFSTGGPILLAIGLVSHTLSLLFAGPAAPLVLLAAAITAASILWPDFGSAAKAAFGELGGFIKYALEDLARLATAIASVFTVDPSQMDFSNPGGGADSTSGTGVLGAGGGMGDFPGGGTGGSNSSGTFGVGQGNADGLIDGFTTRMAERQQEIADAMGAVTTTAQDVFETHSPSEVFRRIGAFIGEGLAGGISDSQAMVAQSVSTLGTAATQSTSSMVSGVLGSLSTLFNGSKKFAMAQALVNAWTGATEALKLPFPANLGAFAKVLATGMAAVKNINSAKPGSAGGGGGAAAAGGGASAAPAQAPTQTMNFTISNDPFGFGERMIRQLSTQINEASRNGMNIKAAVR